MLQLIFLCVTLLSDIDIHDVSGYTVGTQYLQNLSISSGEMTQYLCNIKMSGTNCITKKYRVPFFNYVLNDKIVHKYMDRPARFKSLTLSEYCRYLQIRFATILETFILYFTSVLLSNLQNNLINTCLIFLTYINFVNTAYLPQFLAKAFQIYLLNICTNVKAY